MIDCFLASAVGNRILFSLMESVLSLHLMTQLHPLVVGHHLGERGWGGEGVRGGVKDG